AGGPGQYQFSTAAPRRPQPGTPRGSGRAGCGRTSARLGSPASSPAVGCPAAACVSPLAAFGSAVSWRLAECVRASGIILFKNFCCLLKYLYRPINVLIFHSSLPRVKPEAERAV